MTVGELMARLGEFDADVRVIMPCEDGDWCEVESAFDDLAWFQGKSVHLSDERSPQDNVAVVRLFGPDAG